MSTTSYKEDATERRPRGLRWWSCLIALTALLMMPVGVVVAVALWRLGRTVMFDEHPEAFDEQHFLVIAFPGPEAPPEIDCAVWASLEELRQGVVGVSLSDEMDIEAPAAAFVIDPAALAPDLRRQRLDGMNAVADRWGWRRAELRCEDDRVRFKVIDSRGRFVEYIYRVDAGVVHPLGVRRFP